VNADGKKMTDAEWNSSHRSLEVFLSGHMKGVNGAIIQDGFFLICLNAHHEPTYFKLPVIGSDAKWELVLDTIREEGFVQETVPVAEQFQLQGRSLAIVRWKPGQRMDLSKVMADLT
jgi:hypothetical protein